MPAVREILRSFTQVKVVILEYGNTWSKSTEVSANYTKCQMLCYVCIQLLWNKKWNMRPIICNVVIIHISL